MRRSGTAFSIVALGATTAGCSMGSKLDAFAKMDPSEVTGSVAPVRSGNPVEEDMALARIAASDVLTRGDKDSSQPWENPATGARGSVTPLADAYTVNGRTCRNFLASYVNAKSESWIQGEACQTAKGRWDVKSMRPWRRG